MVALDAAGWVATGLGVWTLVRALDVTGGLDAFLLLGAFALSWLIGRPGPPRPRRPRPARRRARRRPRRRRSAPAPRPRWRSPCAWARSPASCWPSALAELAALALARPRGRRARAAPAAPLPAPDRRGTIVVVPTYDEARGAAAVRRALRRDRPRAADRRRQLARRHRRARRRARGGAPVDARPAPRRARTASGWPTAPASPGAWQRGYARDRPDGLRPLAPAREARRDARACSTRATPTSCSATATCRGGGTDGWRATRRALSRVGCSASRS